MIGLLILVIVLTVGYLFWRSIVKPRTGGNHSSRDYEYNPPKFLTGVLPMDSFGPCRCDACLKLRTEALEDNYAVRVAELELAEAWHRIKTELPDKKAKQTLPPIKDMQTIKRCVLCGKVKALCLCNPPESSNILI